MALPGQWNKTHLSKSNPSIFNQTNLKRTPRHRRSSNRPSFTDRTSRHFAGLRTMSILRSVSFYIQPEHFSHLAVSFLGTSEIRGCSFWCRFKTHKKRGTKPKKDTQPAASAEMRHLSGTPGARMPSTLATSARKKKKRASGPTLNPF